MRKHIIRFFGFLTAAGFMLGLGTAGAADLNLIDIKTIVIRVLFSLLLMVIGVIGLKLSGCKYVL